LLVTDRGADHLLDGRSPPLGTPAGPRAEVAVTVPTTATFVWYSDGLIERRGNDLDHGLDRLAAAAAALPGTLPWAKPQAWADALLRHLFQSHGPCLFMMQGFRGFTAHQGAEDGSRFLVQVRWETIEELEDVVSSGRFERCWSPVEPFVVGGMRVEHYQERASLGFQGPGVVTDLGWLSA